MSTPYWQKLRDPRWQRKRLEIMDRDKFECQLCGDNESTLNVHHKFYLRGLDPWDYPNVALVTLCEGCHGDITEMQERFFMALNELPVDEMPALVRTAEEWFECPEVAAVG